MKQGIFTVKENMQLTPTTWRMKLEGDVSAVTAPGQFIDIKLDEHFLRRPISICDVEYYEAPADSKASPDAPADRSGSFTTAENGITDRTESAQKSGAVTIIYKVLGQGTEEMTRLAPGARLDILTGLGNGYDLSDAGSRPLLIGGGVGIPPLYLAAKLLCGEQRIEKNPDAAQKTNNDDIAARASKLSGTLCDGRESGDEQHSGELHRDESNVTVILGFNSADEIYYADEFRALGCEVVVATADGSSGIKGFVTDAFEALAAGANDHAAGTNDYAAGVSDISSPFTHFYTCGPGPMLKAVYKKVYEEAGISGQMSFEERMGCGFGACMGCSIRTKNGNKRICKDGPVFRTEEVEF